MGQDGGRHGGRIAVHWAPRSPALLREVLGALKEPELPRRRRSGADPGQVAAALAAESQANPVWTHAVVFRTCRPIRLPINGGVDYDLFAAPWQARRALAGDWSPAFSEPELWEAGDGGWRRAA